METIDKHKTTCFDSNPYQRGLNDAWETARKLIQVEYENAHDVFDLAPIFNKLSPVHAADYVRRMEAQQRKADGPKPGVDAPEAPDAITALAAEAYHIQNEVPAAIERLRQAIDGLVRIVEQQAKINRAANEATAKLEKVREFLKQEGGE